MTKEIEKKKWYKRFWVWVLIFFGVIFFIGMLSPSETPTRTNSASEPKTCTPNWQCTNWATCTSTGTQTRTCTDANNCDSTNNKPSESQSCEYSQTIINLGEKVTIEDMEYTVGEEVFVLPVIGSDYIQKEADGTFIILSVAIKNNGKNEVFLTSNSFKIKDSQGRKYNADTGASMYLGTMGFNGLVFKTLGPGLSTNGDIVFDVPADDTELVLEITGEGLFAGTKSVKIGDVSDFV